MTKRFPRSNGWTTALATCAALAWLCSQAAAQAPGHKVGELDIADSRVYILVGATGLGHEHGVEGHLTSGSVQLGSAQGAGELVFNMPSFVAETPAARKYVGLAGDADGRQVTANMLGPDVLDVANFPQATFSIQSAIRDNATGQYLLDGQFALHGVAQHIQVPAQAEMVNGMIHLRGQFAILQTRVWHYAVQQSVRRGRRGRQTDDLGRFVVVCSITRIRSLT